MHVITNPQLVTLPEDSISSKAETNKAAKSLERFCEIEKMCSIQEEEPISSNEMVSLDPTPKIIPTL